MLHSMTGFARAAGESAFGTLTCEVRAVNHRYFDAQFRLPEELRPQEIELRQRIGATVKRGKIECSLHLRRSLGDSGRLLLNDELVRQIDTRLAELSRKIHQTGSVDPIDVLRWPGVVEEPEIDTESLYAAAQALLDKALAALDTMRASEGQRISDMLDSRCGEILEISATVRARIPEILDAVRTKLLERLERLKVDADPGRLETELALIAQKLDVDEEVDRLESHVSEIRKALSQNGPVGRRLDFLMQELNREANTLGSKSADKATTKAAVDLKVLIEQMREQIQNVE